MARAKAQVLHGERRARSSDSLLLSKRIVYRMKENLVQNPDKSLIDCLIETRIATADKNLAINELVEMRDQVKKSLKYAMETGEATGYLTFLKPECFNMLKRELVTRIGFEPAEREYQRRLELDRRHREQLDHLSEDSEDFSEGEKDSRFGEEVVSGKFHRVHKVDPDPPTPQYVPRIDVSNLRDENINSDLSTFRSGHPSPPVQPGQKKNGQKSSGSSEERFFGANLRKPTEINPFASPQRYDKLTLEKELSKVSGLPKKTPRAEDVVPTDAVVLKDSRREVRFIRSQPIISTQRSTLTQTSDVERKEGGTQTFSEKSSFKDDIEKIDIATDPPSFDELAPKVDQAPSTSNSRSSTPSDLSDGEILKKIPGKVMTVRPDGSIVMDERSIPEVESPKKDPKNRKWRLVRSFSDFNLSNSEWFSRLHSPKGKDKDGFVKDVMHKISHRFGSRSSSSAKGSGLAGSSPNLSRPETPKTPIAIDFDELEEKRPQYQFFVSSSPNRSIRIAEEDLSSSTDLPTSPNCSHSKNSPRRGPPIVLEDHDVPVSPRKKNGPSSRMYPNSPSSSSSSSSKISSPGFSRGDFVRGPKTDALKQRTESTCDRISRIRQWDDEAARRQDVMTSSTTDDDDDVTRDLIPGSCGVVDPSPGSYKNKRASNGQPYEPTHHEHVANTLSHAIGIGPSVLVFHYFMIGEAHRELQYWLMLLYGTFTTLLFASSTVYHTCELLYRQKNERRKLRYYLHIFDRAAIYLFIAASYTPWLTLRHCGYPGLNLKWMIWVFAILGILYQYNFHERYKTLETLLYIAIAGGPSVAIFTMNDRSGLDLMMVGGACYAVGVIFFKLDGVIAFAHAIWHVFVLMGASCHTYAVYAHLLGPDRSNPMPEIVL
ncbi:unnamed protein product [Caenorhabditis auriculariae]|uniref:Uncharacterized protein n=1 Tax=Caenorhabditis auriculariae TaxID=2777116 RepID=A0A8S1HPN9_9PELO|nr:unnamed protein product [Caenorhabditis auriculariae]